MSTRNKPSETGPTTTTRIRAHSKEDAEKAVAIKRLSGESINLPRFISDSVDAIAAPILKAAGVTPSSQGKKAKVTK